MAVCRGLPQAARTSSMPMPMTKRLSIGPFFFFGLGGGGGGAGCGGGAAWAVGAAGWELFPELEAQPTRPANTIAETRILMPDIFFISLYQWVSFSLTASTGNRWIERVESLGKRQELMKLFHRPALIK